MVVNACVSNLISDAKFARFVANMSVTCCGNGDLRERKGGREKKKR